MTSPTVAEDDRARAHEQATPIECIETDPKLERPELEWPKLERDPNAWTPRMSVETGDAKAKRHAGNDTA